ncbi:MAG: AAA family ATPase [Polyangiaceae bacterium]
MPSKPSLALVPKTRAESKVGAESRAALGAPAPLAPERDEFVGREAELAELFDAWHSGPGLCSIVGPGGSGKTRLAQRFARLLQDTAEGADAVVFCDLSTARTALDSLNAVAWACDATLPRRGDTDGLIAHLGQVLARRGRLLLVLDNAEHVLDVSRAMLGTWLDAAPELSLLVTTRERLRVRGERCVTLGPLALPSTDADPEAILATDAVQLFLARAQAVHHAFPSGPDVAPVLAQLVQKLEGLPLAIELCAARAGVLGPAELLTRIERRLETLVSRVASVPRHATLRAALDWSWQLLDPLQQRAIAQCAVFRGGFDLAAAESVLDLKAPTLDVLEALIDKSLIKAQDGVHGQRRFALLESVCELCDERADPEERAAVEERHARYYLEVAAPWAERASRSGDAKSRQLLEAESHNLLAVHARGVKRLAREQALAAALCLEPLYARRGPLGRFVDLIDEAMPPDELIDTLRGAAPDLTDSLLRKAWLARGIAKRAAGDIAGAVLDLQRAREDAEDTTAVWAAAQLGVAHLVLRKQDEAESLLQRAMEQAEALGDPFASGQVHAAYAILRGAQERLDEAFDHDKAAAGCFRKVGATSEEAIMQFFRGYLHLSQGSFAEAEHYLSVGLEALREIGERRLEAHALADLGMLRIDQCRPADAEAFLTDAIKIAADVGDDHCRGLAHGYAGQNELERGALEHAREHFLQAVQILSEVGDRRWVAQYRAPLACVETLLGRRVLGSELFEEAERELKEAGEGHDALVLAGWRAVVARHDGDPEPARTALESVPDKPPYHLRAVVRLLGSDARQPAGPVLSVGPEASWFEIDGERVSLARRGNLRRILQALLRAKDAEPPIACDVPALFEAGWPDERLNASSSHRVHVAMATLRKLGLAKVLVTQSEGYRLGDEVQVERVDG